MTRKSTPNPSKDLPELPPKACEESALAALRADLQLAIDQLDRGEGIPAEEVFRSLRARGRKGDTSHRR